MNLQYFSNMCLFLGGMLYKKINSTTGSSTMFTMTSPKSAAARQTRGIWSHKMFVDMISYNMFNSEQSANSHLWVISCFCTFDKTTTLAPLYVFPNMSPECSHHVAMMFLTLPHSNPNLSLTFSLCFPDLSTYSDTFWSISPMVFAMIRHKERQL